MKTNPQLINIGKISKPHGLQGFFYLKPLIDLNIDDCLFVGHSSHKTQKVTIKDIKEHKGKTIIQLSEFPDRTALEKNLGQTLWAYEVEEEEDENSSPLLEEKVYDINKKDLGVVSGFYNCGAGDIIIITNTKGLSLELPFNSVYFNLDKEPEEPLTLLACHTKFEDLWHS